ncbi:MAG: AraC family transcriptional regulator [Planctomycetota bacterium]|nr:AraC family transcriptional regulator [Planctomycetota bacterium]
MLFEQARPIAAGFFQSDHATRRPPLDPQRQAALVYVTSGDGTMRIGAWEFPMRRGDLFAVPQDAEFQPRLKTGSVLGFYFAYFELDPHRGAQGQHLGWPWDLGADLHVEIDAAEPPVAAGDFRPEVAGFFRQLQHELGRRLPAAGAAARAQLTLLGITFARLLAESHRKKEETRALAPVAPRGSGRFGRSVPEPVAKVMDYVQMHLDRELKLPELARVAGFSERRLIQVFRKSLGLSPMAYVRDRRVKEAERLLSQRGVTIKDVAARLNFADAHHFSRVFRQVTGISPSEFVRGRAPMLARQSGRFAVSRPDQVGYPMRESNRTSNRASRISGRFGPARG